MAVKKSTRTVRRKGNGALFGAVIVAVGLVISAIILSKGNPKVEASQKEIPIAPVVGEFDTVQVPVPVSPVPAGAKIKSVRFTMKRYPTHQVPKGAVLDLAGVSEGVAVAALPAHLPVFRENISLTASAVNPVVDSIPEGMRAITIRVDATSAVEGWAGSGAVVDVLLTTKETSSVVAEKVKILSAERSIEPVSTGASPNIPSTVTLLVTQEQALAISSAINVGKITFALRSNVDDLTWTRSAFNTKELSKGPKVSSKKSAIKGYVDLGNGKNYALLDGQWVENHSEEKSLVKGVTKGVAKADD